MGDRRRAALAVAWPRQDIQFINTIRAWLGHVSLQTTNLYAEVDLEMKAKALKYMDKQAGMRIQKRWHRKPDLLEFLKRI